MLSSVPTIDIAAALLRRARAGEIPHIWCDVGHFSVQIGYERIPLIRSDAQRMAEGAPLVEVMQPKPASPVQRQALTKRERPLPIASENGVYIRGRLVAR